MIRATKNAWKVYEVISQQYLLDTLRKCLLIDVFKARILFSWHFTCTHIPNKRNIIFNMIELKSNKQSIKFLSFFTTYFDHWIISVQPLKKKNFLFLWFSIYQQIIPRIGRKRKLKYYLVPRQVWVQSLWIVVLEYHICSFIRINEH